MNRESAFTLIELLVAVAILGILTTLVVSQVGKSRLKARDAAVKNDVVQAGKAIETFRDNDLAAGKVISRLNGVDYDTLDDSGSDTQIFRSIFSGTEVVNGPGSAYGLAFTKTPGFGYKYTYNAPVPINEGGRELISIEGTCYLFYSNLQISNSDYIYIRNGDAGELNGSTEPGC